MICCSSNSANNYIGDHFFFNKKFEINCMILYILFSYFLKSLVKKKEKLKKLKNTFINIYIILKYFN
jgi:hypothetical protein